MKWFGEMLTSFATQVGAFNFIKEAGNEHGLLERYWELSLHGLMKFYVINGQRLNIRDNDRIIMVFHHDQRVTDVLRMIDTRFDLLDLDDHFVQFPEILVFIDNQKTVHMVFSYPCLMSTIDLSWWRITPQT